MSRSLDSGPTPPEDGGMERWRDMVEERLGALERDVAIIRTNYVTKEDLHREVAGLHREINSQTWKIVTFVCGFGTVLVSATYFIATQVR